MPHCADRVPRQPSLKSLVADKLLLPGPAKVSGNLVLEYVPLRRDLGLERGHGGLLDRVPVSPLSLGE